MKEKKEFEERVVQVDRVTRVVAGGRRMRFRAAVIVGNRAGRVGIGVDKSNDVIGAVQKAITLAKKNMIDVPIVNQTIPHQINAKFGGAKIFLKPANLGTGIIAGGAVRAVVELAGINNILSKILGSKNKINNLKATIIGLSALKTLPNALEDDKTAGDAAENKANAAKAENPKNVQKGL